MLIYRTLKENLPYYTEQAMKVTADVHFTCKVKPKLSALDKNFFKMQSLKTVRDRKDKLLGVVWN